MQKQGHAGRMHGLPEILGPQTNPESERILESWQGRNHAFDRSTAGILARVEPATLERTLTDLADIESNGFKLDLYDEKYRPWIVMSSDILRDIASEAGKISPSILKHSIRPLTQVAEDNKLPVRREYFRSVQQIAGKLPLPERVIFLEVGFRVLSEKLGEQGYVITDDSLASIGSIVSKAMPRDVTTLVSNQITKTLDRFKTYGGRHDGRILKAVDDSLEGVEPAAFPQFFDNAITYAIKYGVDNGDFSSPGGINRALNLARNLTRAGIECEYMSRLLGFCMAKGFNAHKVVEYYCSGFDQEAERIRTSPVKIHVRENASAIAAKGLMASAGLKDVTLTYGVELQPYSVLANMWDTFDKELLEAQLQDHELQRKAKERLGSQRYEMLRSNINAKLSSVDSVYGPVKRVERHQHQSPEMVFEFFDRSQSGPTGLSYQPFKYHLPQPVKAEYAEAFSRSLGFQPGEKVVVLGSPEPSESERFIEAYSQIPPDKKPKLIIAPRNTDQYGAIVKQLETHSIQHRFRSDQENNGADVVVMDTMGELLMAYAIADKAFIGENRNILEPASQGKMPHYFAGSWEKNQMALDLLKRERACCEVSTPEEIMAAIVLEPEPSAGKRALSVVAEMRDEIIPRYGRLALRMAHLWEMQCNPSKANALFDS